MYFKDRYTLGLKVNSLWFRITLSIVKKVLIQQFDIKTTLQNDYMLYAIYLCQVTGLSDKANTHKVWLLNWSKYGTHKEARHWQQHLSSTASHLGQDQQSRMNLFMWVWINVNALSFIWMFMITCFSAIKTWFLGISKFPFIQNINPSGLKSPSNTLNSKSISARSTHPLRNITHNTLMLSFSICPCHTDIGPQHLY